MRKEKLICLSVYFPKACVSFSLGNTYSPAAPWEAVWFVLISLQHSSVRFCIAGVEVEMKSRTIKEEFSTAPFFLATAVKCV